MTMQTFGNHVDSYYDASGQIVDDLRRRAEAHFRRQEREKSALTALADFEAHRTRVRANFMDAIGGLPTERAPLKVRLKGRVDQPNFSIEKIIYESLPGFRVTAACYVPRKLRRRVPAVVFVHGHWDAGKSQSTYQAVCRDLADNGFVVLAVDPLGQGERSQYYENGERVVGSACLEHTHAGLQFFLQGASIARHFIWDVMRGIDYLESRADVDAARIGITGNSGGGTQTCLLMMSEPRLAAAAPCTFVMTLESYMKTGQPQDAEQIVRNCMTAGPDHDDFITAMAPKPVLVGAVAYDFFPIEGTLEAVRRAKQIYALYGKADHVDIAMDNSLHAYTPGLREAAVNWFKKHLRHEKPDFKTGRIEPLPESALWATKSGQLASDNPSSKTIFDLNRQRLPELPTRKSVAELRNAVEQALGVPQAGDRSATIRPRVINESMVDGWRVEKIFFFSAPDIVVTGVMTHPRGADAGASLPTTLLLLENGTRDIPNERPRIESLLRAGERVFVFDPRGIGAVKARSLNTGDEGPYPMFNTEYKLGCDAAMLGLSTLGLRVFDVLRGYDYLKSRRDVARVNLWGVGSGAVFGYFAAALEAGFADLTFESMLASYRHLCETRDYNNARYGLKIMAWGILRHFDLPDLLLCLRPRATRFITPLDARGEVLSAKKFHDGFIQPAKARGCLRPGWRPTVQTWV